MEFAPDHPVSGKYVKKSLVYKVGQQTRINFLIGLTEITFLTRFLNENNTNKIISTEVSKNVWNLRQWQKLSNTVENYLCFWRWLLIADFLMKSKGKKNFNKFYHAMVIQVKMTQVSLFFFAFMMLLIAQKFKHAVFEPRNEILRLGWVELWEGLMLVMTVSPPSTVLIELIHSHWPSDFIKGCCIVEFIKRDENGCK